MAAARFRARQLDVPCTITADWVEIALADGRCAATGLPLDFSVNSGRCQKARAPSLDRKVGRRGYTFSNTRVVCWQYNAAKHAYGDKKLLELARAIVARAA